MLSDTQLNRKLSSELHTLSPHRYLTAALILVVLTAFSSVLLTVYNMGYIGGIEANEALYSKVTASQVDYSHILNLMRISVSIALLVGAIGLWSHKAIGLLLSALSLLWVGTVYTWWYFDSAAFLRNVEVSDYSQLPDVQHIAMLRGANWLDIIVLVAAMTLLCWQIKTLIRLLKSFGKMQ